MRAIAFTALLLLAACGQSATAPASSTTATPALAPAPERVTWTCPGGGSFIVVMDSPVPDEIQLEIGAGIHQLPRAISASGTRYSDGTVEFWEHQGTAAVEGVPGPPYQNCTRG